MLRLRRPAGYDVDFFQGRGWSPACRHNTAVEQAVAWGADHILILGADQVYEPDLLERLVARRQEGYEIVCAMVPTRGYIEDMKMKPFQRMAWRFKGKGTTPIQWDRAELEIVIPNGEMQRIDFIGSGCIMFDADHVLALAKPWFFETIDFKTQKRTACMDTKFAYRLRMEAYGQIWCDTTIRIRHLHDMAIDHTFADRFEDYALPGVGPSDLCQMSTPGASVPESAGVA